MAGGCVESGGMRSNAYPARLRHRKQERAYRGKKQSYLFRRSQRKSCASPSSQLASRSLTIDVLVKAELAQRFGREDLLQRRYKLARRHVDAEQIFLLAKEVPFLQKLWLAPPSFR